VPFQPSSSSANPFDDLEVAARYEDWYLGPGASADRLEKELLSKVLETFLERETLLEVGCGTGHFVRWFGDQGLATVGVDVSTTMLAEAELLSRLGESSFLPGSRKVAKARFGVTGAARPCKKHGIQPTSSIRRAMRRRT